MPFEEVEQGDEQSRVGGAFAKLLSPDSGQVEEALGPLRFIERCCKRRQSERDRVGWSLGVQGVNYVTGGAGFWQGS